VAWCWLACRVLFKIVYVLTCRLLGLFVLMFRGDLAKDAELLVLWLPALSAAGVAWCWLACQGYGKVMK